MQCSEISCLFMQKKYNIVIWILLYFLARTLYYITHDVIRNGQNSIRDITLEQYFSYLIIMVKISYYNPIGVNKVYTITIFFLSNIILLTAINTRSITIFNYLKNSIILHKMLKLKRASKKDNVSKRASSVRNTNWNIYWNSIDQYFSLFNLIFNIIDQYY